MGERMSSSDVMSLHNETRRLPRHVGAVSVFVAPPAGFDYDRLVRLLEERISLAPRYRQKVRTVPGNLAHPVWVDDPSFDITYHVRRCALPRPGGDHELMELAARVQARPLDRSRPLWEMYLVEGLSEGRIAIITKTHEVMADEAGGVDIAHVILDAAPAPRRTVEAVWMPAPEPSGLDLLREAVGDAVRRPVMLLDAARGAAQDAGSTAAKLGSFAGGVLSAGTALLRRPDASPLVAEVGEQRRLAIARTRLDDYRTVRDAVGGTVNDAVLAVVAGALRGWLLSRAAPMRSATSVRALVPVSVADPSLGRHPSRPASVRPLLVDLPVGEPDPILRLTQLRYAMATHKASGRAVAADRIAALSGYAPSTLHALGARAADGLTRRMFSLVVTNVPGPQVPLFAAGARMTEMFPVLPLGAGQALSIALTSYDGGVFYGVNGDRDAVPEVAMIAELIGESLEELVAAAGDVARAAGSSRAQASRGPGERQRTGRSRSDRSRPPGRGRTRSRDAGHPDPEGQP